MKFENKTPYEGGRYVIQDRNGKDLLVIVIKATFDFTHEGRLNLADNQLPVEPADQYYGDPETTGIRYASDVTFGKKATDIALVGHAVAMKQKTRQTIVSLSVGKLRKKISVFGNRYWKSPLSPLRFSSPEPFEKIPLTYERAFGGKDLSHKKDKHHEYEARNPIGSGFRAKKTGIKRKGQPLPNLEDPSSLIKSPKQRPIPAGLGFICPFWEPRLGYAGTYDEDWQKNRMPLLPEDFDPAWCHAAHPDMIYPGFLQGNEEINIKGVSEKGPYEFFLPGIRPVCKVRFITEEDGTPEMNIEKLFIDADNEQAILVWTAEMEIHNRLYDVTEIECSLDETPEILSETSAA